MTNSAARIVRQLLIDIGVGTDGGVWPVFYSREPAAPDNCITVYKTQGTVQGRQMISGKIVEKIGIQVRVRGNDDEVGAIRMELIRTTLAESVYEKAVHVGTNTYVVHSASKIGEVMSLGTEASTSMRSLFTVNFVAAIRAA